jgi:hypothetical protein
LQSRRSACLRVWANPRESAATFPPVTRNAPPTASFVTGTETPRSGVIPAWSPASSATTVGRGSRAHSPIGSWPYQVDHKHPGEFKAECLQGCQGGTWTHPDGKTRNYQLMKEGMVRLSFGTVRTGPAEPLSDEELDEAASQAKRHVPEVHKRFLAAYGARRKAKHD